MGAKKALLIGVSQYPPGWQSTPAAIGDADTLQLLWLSSEVGNFNDVKLLLNPDRQGMEEEIYALATAAQADDLLVLYFSGQGYRDRSGKLYLITAITRKDMQGELIKPTAVALASVQDILNSSAATQQVVILDSCFESATDIGVDDDLGIAPQLAGTNRLILTASTTPTYTAEQKQRACSLYTRYLVEAIQTGTAHRSITGQVTANQLHEYAQRKVQIAAPAIQPGLYLPQPGFEILLTQTPLIDAKVSYRQDVEARSQNGKTEISDFDRLILNWRRDRLGLSPETTTELEQEVLQPRAVYQQKIQHYQQKLTRIADYQYPLRDFTVAGLERYRQQMGLPSAETTAIATQVITPHEQRYQQYLRQYEQHLAHELEGGGYPPSREVRNELRYLEQQLCLSPEDTIAIKQRLIAHHQEHYQQKLRRYEENFAHAVRNGYPLRDAARQELRQQQQTDRLKDEDIVLVERQILEHSLKSLEEAIAPRSAHPQSDPSGAAEELMPTDLTPADYQQRLQQYQQFFLSKFQPNHALDEQVLYELASQQAILDLKDGAVAASEEAATQQALREHQHHLRQYEQAFIDAVQSESLNQTYERDRLQQLQRDLHLDEQDVELVEKIALELLDYQAIASTASSGSDQPTAETVLEATDPEAAGDDPIPEVATFEDLLVAPVADQADEPEVSQAVDVAESAELSEPAVAVASELAPEVEPSASQSESPPGAEAQFTRTSRIPRSAEPLHRSVRAQGATAVSSPDRRPFWQRLKEPETLANFGLQMLRASLLAMLAIIVGRILISLMVQYLPAPMGQILGIAVFALAVLLAWKALNFLTL